MYLPAVFIQNNVHKMQHGSIANTTNKNGEFVDKFTCGVALLEMPFFLITKEYAKRKGLPVNNYFGNHYAYGIAIGGYLIGFLGLFFLQRGLLRNYSPLVTLLTVMAVFLGTNLFHYTTKEMGMSHVYSFMLISFLVWKVPIFYQKPTFSLAFLIGLVFGWIVLIRPTNILIFLFIILFDVISIADFKERLIWLAKNTRLILAAILGGIVIFIPQLLYWYEMTGSPIFYSYQSEGFPYWNQPKILAVFFDPQNGLFMYSPMVLFMVLGIFAGWKKKESQSISVGLIFLLSTYIFASWWAWWFGGAFGARSYVELYALLSMPFAFLTKRILNHESLTLQYFLLLLYTFFNFYSVRLSYLYHAPWDGADWRWNIKKMYEIWSQLFS